MSISSNQVNICTIALDNISREHVFVQIHNVMNIDAAGHKSSAKKDFLRIATINPDFLLRARGNEKFHANLMQADIRIADGIGLKIVGLLMGKKVAYYPGADLFFDMLAQAQKHGWRAHFCCRVDGLSGWESVQRALHKKYPSLQVTGEDVVNYKCKEICDDVPRLIFANFGAPEQEHFLENLRTQGVRGVTVGVGGAFDFLTGNVHRAPQWVRCIGMEWLWRTAHQPKRTIKMFRSVVFFPIIALWDNIFRKV